MIYHSSIFYPGNRDELLAAVSPIAAGVPHRAFILPHQALQYSAHLYREAFASIPDGTRIVAFLPLHREPLIRDSSSILFSPSEREERTELGIVRIGSLGYPSSASYEEEEYSLELLYPFIAYHNPASTLYPVFMHARTSQDARLLAGIAEALDDGRTAFIISSNMTGRGLAEEKVKEERDRTIKAIESGDGLLDQWHKGRIGACGTPAIEALQRALRSRWRFAGLGTEERMAGHAYFYMD